MRGIAGGWGYRIWWKGAAAGVLPWVGFLRERLPKGWEYAAGGKDVIVTGNSRAAKRPVATEVTGCGWRQQPAALGKEFGWRVDGVRAAVGMCLGAGQQVSFSLKPAEGKWSSLELSVGTMGNKEGSRYDRNIGVAQRILVKQI